MSATVPKRNKKRNAARAVHRFIWVLCFAAGTQGLMMTCHAESNWARNPRIAVQEEYSLAVKRGTVEALELFIARHPQSELAVLAAEQIREMKAAGSQSSDGNARLRQEP